MNWCVYISHCPVFQFLDPCGHFQKVQRGGNGVQQKHAYGSSRQYQQASKLHFNKFVYGGINFIQFCEHSHDDFKIGM
jgi:hypothetical protein